MTERKAKSLCLLINGDLEFYVLNQYIMPFSHDLMISRSVSVSDTLEKSGDKMSAGKLVQSLIVHLLYLEVNCLCFVVEPEYNIICHVRALAMC